MTYENEDSKELIKHVKVIRNLIVATAQILPTIENKFSRKSSVDSIINLGKILNDLENELNKRGIYTYE